MQVLTAPSSDPDTLVRYAAELVLIRERTHIDAWLLARLPALRLISQTGTTWPRAPHVASLSPKASVRRWRQQN